MPQKRARTSPASQKMNSPQQKKSKTERADEKQIPRLKRTSEGTVEDSPEEAAP